MASQAAVYVCSVLAIGLVFAAFDRPEYSVLCAGALAVGILIGLGTAAGAFVERASGAALAVATGVLMLTGVGLLSSQGATVPPITVVLGALAVLGMDWRLVARLRILPFGSGLMVVATVGLERGWAYPAAILWFVVAIGALWLLENDRRTALDRPDLAPSDPALPRTLDVVRTIGVGLFVGVIAALVLGNPSCSPWSPDATPKPPDIGNPGLSDPGLSDPGSGDPTDGGRFQPTDRVPKERRLEGDGQERTYDIDEYGNRTFTDPETGEKYTVSEEGGRTVVRDSRNRKVAELDDEGVVAGDGTGDAPRYQQDGQGRVYTETPDGDRLYLDRSGDRTVLRDEDGNIVAEGDPSGDHLVIRDPEGTVLVPDPDGDGEIPAPPGGVADGAFSSDEGRSVTYDGDRTIVTDADGERRTYDTDAQGRERVKIERPGEADRTFAYEDRGSQTDVYEYDEDGKLVRRYRYDPNGRLVDPSGEVGGNAPSTDGGDQSQPADQPDDEKAEDDGGSDIPWALIGGGILVIAALVALGVWLSRRPKPEGERPWAEEQVRAIDAFGAGHGRPRRPSESNLEHTRRLAGSVAPDDRFAEVGRALSDALFGRTDIGPERRAWVEATLAEITEAHPPPGWNERRKNKKADPVPTP
ncbi:hypothetical protein BH10ACT1_BH10ACT1_12000 [soil metagenome]